MDSPLRSILANSAVQVGANDGSFTHLTKYPSKEKWRVRDQSLGTFWTSYCKLVEAEPDSQFHVAERAGKYVPIIASFKLRFQSDEDEFYDDDFLLRLTKCLQESIEALFRVKEERIELLCVLLESMPYQEEGNTVIRLRFQFPYCKVDTVHLTDFRDRAIKSFRSENILSSMRVQPMDDWKDMYPRGDEPTLMYLSTDAPHEEKMYLKYIMTTVIQDHIDACEPPEVDIDRAYLPSSHSQAHNGLIPASTFTSGDNRFWFPIFLSLEYWSTITMARMGQNAPTRQSVTPSMTADPNVPSATEDYLDTDDLPPKACERFLQMLNPKRFTEKYYWMDIGKALHKSYGGDQDGLQLWYQYTGSYSPELAAKCADHYYAFSDMNNPISIKTLAWYAKQDSPTPYKTWSDAWVKHAICKVLDQTSERDAASAFYRQNWLDYGYTVRDKSVTWWYYRDHRWRKSGKGMDVRKALNGFITVLEKMKAVAAQKVTEADNEITKIKQNEICDKLSNLVKRMGQRGFFNNVMKWSEDAFYDTYLDTHMNKSPFITCHANCVFEVVDRNIVFRPGKPQDYVSKTTGVRFDSTYTMDHPNVKKIHEFLMQIFGSEEVVEYVLKWTGSRMKGRNSDKLVLEFVGMGDNGKSTLIKLYCFALGDYAIKGPTSLLVGKRSLSSSPTPELARSEGARIIFFQEAEETEPVNTGILRELSGGDSIFCRFLHDNGKDIEVHFCPVTASNKPTPMNTAPKAVKNRVKIMEFTGTFSEDAPKNKEEQWDKRIFPIDKFFEEQLPYLAPAFLWLAYHYYAKYMKDGLEPPQSVKDASKRYTEMYDMYANFVSHRVERILKSVTSTPRPNGGVTIIQEVDRTIRMTVYDVYRMFKSWHRICIGKETPSLPVVQDALSSKWGHPEEGAYWYGVRPIQQAAVTAGIPY